MLFSMPSWSASACTAGPKPWIAQHDRLELEGQVAQRADRLALLVERGAQHAVASSVRPASIAAITASSMSAIPDIDCTGPSCRNSAEAPRSSCSAVISWSESRACSVETSLELLVDPLVLVALRDEERGGECAGGRHRAEQPDQRRGTASRARERGAHDRAGDDQRRRGSPRLVDDRFAKRNRYRVRPRVRLELREDVPDVALHRLLADEELARPRPRWTCRRRAAGGSPLAAGEHVLALAGQERGHQRRDRRSPRRTRPSRSRGGASGAALP